MFTIMYDKRNMAGPGKGKDGCSWLLIDVQVILNGCGQTGSVITSSGNLTVFIHVTKQGITCVLHLKKEKYSRDMFLS